VEWFVNEVLPLLRNTTLHVIAGSHPERFPAQADLNQRHIELEGFVADVRPAYRRAAVVIAPLTASAGTNIKILEAMAMGKAVVSTPAGVNGLDLVDGRDFLLARTAPEMARVIEGLLADQLGRRALEVNARVLAESRYNWDRIAEKQARLYRELVR
jgi:glycosyltransferase involved in cell wall biosynthesis